MTFTPKGGMCLTCKKLKEDCSKYNFSEMQVIKKFKLFSIVKCDHHIRRK